MASKLAYLQRYMSAADAPDKKQRKKKKKPATAGAVPSRMRVVDDDHEWENDAPSAAAVERAWEADAADEELPVVLADGEVVDPSDLPVYVNAGEFVDELSSRQRRADAEREADLSPPRRAATTQPERAAPSARSDARRRKDSSDDSPPRRSGAGGAEKRERRGRSKSDDASPPRRRVQRGSEGEEDASPPRRQRASARPSRGNDDDGSPPRRQRPEERPRRRRESDVSPPRRQQTEERERRRGDARGDDASPPRRRAPERRGRSRSRSPRRASSSRREAARSSRDARRRSRSGSRARRSPSPARSDRRGRERATSTRERDDDAGGDAAKPPKLEPATSAPDPEPPAPRAGLFTATEFAAEHQRKLRQNDLLRTAAAEDLGANAETVYRDKRGRKLDMLSEMVRQQEVLDGKRERQAREEYEWGTGKVQKEELKSQQQLLHEIQSAPFARREDDPALEKMRKERVRAFDPMLSKVFQEDDALGATASKKTRKKSKKASAAKPTYSGPPAPPNRFGIRPGYRWDGVVRGTGWEEKLLLRENKQSAVSEEAYRYAVADM